MQISHKRPFLLSTGLYFILIPAVGLLIFTSGFFLTRVGIEKKSPNVIPLNPDSIEDGVISFEGFARFHRVVILLIDALRYDFVKHSSQDSHNLKPYHNHMKTVNHLTSKYPDKAKLFKFVADPPTTTMQRIKGLTTGSLPTFVDQTSNFNSPSITEDTVLHQLSLAGRKTLFAGDDTWMDLFPESFSEAHPYPSFNVRDLHTVDEGVVRHLFPFLARRDWSLIIGHFLGVDHCGHIYGPDHSTMKDKLIQLDSVINSVVELLSDDTLLVVMGDHGMTETGDHGGDTWNETHAALFIYSPRSIFPPGTSQYPLISSLLSDSVSQKNIVPTLSLLLGLPIPYSNLGHLIPELFWVENSGSNTSLYFLSQALLVNCLQVWRYLKHYSLLSNDIPRNDMTSLQVDMDAIISLSQVNDTSNLLGLINRSIGFLKRSESICQSIWAKFNINKMSIGIAIMTISVCLQIYHLLTSHLQVTSYFSKCILVASILSSIIVSVLSISFTAGNFVNVSFFQRTLLCLIIILIMVYIILLKMRFVWNLFKEYLPFRSLLPIFLTILSTCSLFSNSYIIREDSRIEFLLQTYNCILMVKSLSEWYSQSRNTHYSSTRLLPNILKPALLLVLMRATRHFHVCRPEQSPCESSYLSLPLLNLAEKSFIGAVLRFSLSTLSLILPTTYIIKKYRLYSNKFYSRGLVAIYVLIITFWLTKIFPEPPVPPSYLGLYHTSSPRIIYLISLCLLFYAIWNVWHSKSSSQFTLEYSCVSGVVWLLCCLLVGDGMVPSLALLLTYLMLLSNLTSDQCLLPTLFLSHYFFLLSSKFYFAIGHQFTVQSIRYEAAFTGFHGNLDSFLLAGFLIIINMFASYIWIVFVLPLFLIETVKHHQGRERSDSIPPNIINTFLQILCMACFQVLITCVVAFIHRRHLMVWNVFAPRFVYEAVIYCVLVVAILIVLIIVYGTNLSFNS